MSRLAAYFSDVLHDPAFYVGGLLGVIFLGLLMLGVGR